LFSIFARKIIFKHHKAIIVKIISKLYKSRSAISLKHLYSYAYIARQSTSATLGIVAFPGI